jgi:hypothetical protein
MTFRKVRALGDDLRPGARTARSHDPNSLIAARFSVSGNLLDGFSANNLRRHSYVARQGKWSPAQVKRTLNALREAEGPTS